ncbi:hypothetical protein HYALB_00005048 [Hymenoscyphus albidus]|uniref:Copper homeostasis protein cutC homolog n=1 Tax=Hymenoscyphus albidus TaxID=595503 RepID=A0A9N9LU32_9HELO|nr:hypothetical protein HYALB_00005048 [Hymenoscyphus albidus]
MINLEIASFTPTSAHHAAQNGATRIELCTSMPSGGLTPPLTSFQTLKTLLTPPLSSPNTTPPTPLSKPPIHIMIRPHADTFTYTPASIQEMLHSIAAYKAEGGCTGFVLGALTAQNLIDIPTSTLLLNAAAPLPCTFHRAFDSIPPPLMLSQLDVLIELGFKYLLTSGGAAKAGGEKGEDWGLLKELVDGGREGGLEVIVGGGVRRENVEVLVRGTGARWVHSSAVVGEGEMVSVEEVRGLRGILDELEE